MHHEKESTGTSTLEGEVGTPPLPSDPAPAENGGVDFWVFGLVAVVVALISVQNVWLRRKAERENAEGTEA